MLITSNLLIVFTFQLHQYQKTVGTHLLNRICKDSGLQISTLKAKVMAFRGTDPVRPEIVIDGTVPVSYTHLDVYKRQLENNF